MDALAASGLNGSGRTIGLLAQTNVNVGDTTFFRQYFGLPANDPVVVLNGPDPGIVSGDELESDIDIQWAGAVAPAARVLLVASESTATAYGVDLSALYAVSNNLADVLSLSYGACELDFGDADTAFFTNVWAQAAAQGISVLVASGDCGAAGCDPGGDNFAKASVNGLGSSPYVTCVGGTQFLDAAPSTYWNSANDPTTKKSVKGYVPETTWNGSGGGKSVLFARPPWQNVTGLPADGARYVPDVALAASTHTPYMIVRGHTTGSTGLVVDFGGTSLLVPGLRRAGGPPLPEGRHPPRQPEPAPLRGRTRAVRPGKRLGAARLAAGALGFHDVTTGNNSVAGVTGYAAGPGYDAATGLGSVDAAALAAALPAPAPATTDFTLGAIPESPSIPACGTVIVSLTLSQIGAAAGDAVATVSLAGLPAGVAAEFRPGNPANVVGRRPFARPARDADADLHGCDGRRDISPRPHGDVGIRREERRAFPHGARRRRHAVRMCRRTDAGRPRHSRRGLVALHVGLRGREPQRNRRDARSRLRSRRRHTRRRRTGRRAHASSRAAALRSGRHRVPRANGWTLPSDGSGKIGTFFATFVGVTDPASVFAGSRTSTPNLSASVGGAFGTFATAVPSGSANASGDTWIYGLRENASFRSNLAVVHAPGTASGATSGPVSLEIQLFDGDSGAPAGAPLARTLQPGEFFQYNQVLTNAPAGVTNGYARVPRTSGSDRFIAYGVVNDGGSAGGGTSDGSFLAVERDRGPRARSSSTRPVRRTSRRTSRSRTRRPRRSPCHADVHGVVGVLGAGERDA